MSRRADGRKVAEWRGRFERFRRSGLSVGRFCLAEKVSVPSFYQWRKKLAARSVAATARSSAGIARSSAGIARAAAGAEAAESFARVRLVGAATVAAWLPGGTRLEIPLGDTRVMQLAIEALVRADASPSQSSSPSQGSSHTLDSSAVAWAGGATC